MRWLEITADYHCNNRCLGCFAVDDAGPSMDASELAETLAWGREGGARWLWLGGGEPTLRDDLFRVALTARRLGYERIKLQTNGMRLAYVEYTRRCAMAGVTEVAFSIKGATAEVHDRLAQTPGCHALMLKGMANARAEGLTLEADVLVYRSQAHTLPAIVSRYRAEGVSAFRMWLLSAAGSRDPEVQAEVPRIDEVMPALIEALALAPEGDEGFLSLHTPACTIPPEHHRMLFSAAELGLVVANPGGHRFRLEASPMEGGHYPEGCSRCVARPRCGGVRADYVAIHGDEEFRPLDAGAAARSTRPRLVSG